MRRPPTAMLALLALALPACGDSSSQTKEGFVAAADNVCMKLFSEFARADEADPKTPEEIVEANAFLAKVYGQLARDLSGVELPAEGEARRGAEAFVASVRRGEALLARLRSASERFEQAARAEDAQATAVAGNDVRSALDAFRAARAESDRLAVAYGLNFCGNLG